jgi:hypothetical protein
VFENRVLRRLFGPKRDEMMGGWTKLHNEELRDFYFNPGTIRVSRRRMMMGGTCSTYGENMNAYRLLVGKPEGRSPLRRPRRRWLDNIRMDLGEVGWGDVDWIGMAQDTNRRRTLMNSVLKLRVPKIAGKLWSGLSSSAQLHRISYKPRISFISFDFLLVYKTRYERHFTGMHINLQVLKRIKTCFRNDRRTHINVAIS